MINIKDRIVDEISTVSVMNDKDVVRLDFKIKNQVTDLLKLTDCVVYINYMNGSTKDRYLVTDLSGDDEVTFSWTLGRNATAKQGKTYFVICAQKTNGNEIAQEWNSVLTSFDVKKGLETLTAPVEPYTDIFAQLTEMIEDKQDKLIAGENITIEGNVISASGGGTGDFVPIYFFVSATDMYNAWYEYIRDTTLVNGKFVLLISMEDWYNGTDNLEAGIYKVSYGSTVEIVMTTDKINALAQSLSPTIMSAVAALYYNKQEVDNLISALGAVFSFKGTVATTSQLPLSGNTVGDVYYVTAKSLEYVWINDGTARWEPLGEIVDLSAYYTKTETDTLLNAKADASSLSNYVATSAVKQTSGRSTTDLMSQKAVTDELASKLSNPLTFTDKAVAQADWVSNSDNTYTYKAVITCTGVTADMLATVIFSEEDATSGNYSMECRTGTDSVTIYSNVNTAITVPTIVVGAPVEIEAMHNYSTNEQVIGTWIDNIPLYQKSFVISATDLSSGTYVTDMLSADVDDIMFDLSATMIRTKDGGGSGDEIIKSISYWDTYNNLGLRIDTSDTYIKITAFRYSGVPNNVFSGDSVITIRYTKTTD